MIAKVLALVGLVGLVAAQNPCLADEILIGVATLSGTSDTEYTTSPYGYSAGNSGTVQFDTSYVAVDFPNEQLVVFDITNDVVIYEDFANQQGYVYVPSSSQSTGANAVCFNFPIYPSSTTTTTGFGQCLPDTLEPTSRATIGDDDVTVYGATSQSTTTGADSYMSSASITSVTVTDDNIPVAVAFDGEMISATVAYNVTFAPFPQTSFTFPTYPYPPYPEYTSSGSGSSSFPSSFPSSFSFPSSYSFPTYAPVPPHVGHLNEFTSGAFALYFNYTTDVPSDIFDLPTQCTAATGTGSEAAKENVLLSDMTRIANAQAMSEQPLHVSAAYAQNLLKLARQLF